MDKLYPIYVQYQQIIKDYTSKLILKLHEKAGIYMKQLDTQEKLIKGIGLGTILLCLLLIIIIGFGNFFSLIFGILVAITLEGCVLYIYLIKPIIKKQDLLKVESIIEDDFVQLDPDARSQLASAITNNYPFINYFTQLVPQGYQKQKNVLSEKSKNESPEKNEKSKVAEQTDNKDNSKAQQDTLKQENSYMDISLIKTNLEDIGKEEFLDFNEKFKKVLTQIVESQQEYFKKLQNISSPSIFGEEKNSLFTRNEQEVHFIKIDTLNNQEKELISKHLVNNQLLYLPDWNHFRTILRKSGTILQSGIIVFTECGLSALSALRNEFNEKQEEVEKVRLQFLANYEEKLNILKKLWLQLEVLRKQYEQNLNQYQMSKQNQENEKNLINLEMSYRLSEVDFKRCQIKIEDIKLQFLEFSRKLPSINKQIIDFKENMNNSKIHLFSTALKTLVYDMFLSGHEDLYTYTYNTYVDILNNKLSKNQQKGQQQQNSIQSSDQSIDDVRSPKHMFDKEMLDIINKLGQENHPSTENMAESYSKQHSFFMQKIEDQIFCIRRIKRFFKAFSMAIYVYEQQTQKILQEKELFKACTITQNQWLLLRQYLKQNNNNQITLKIVLDDIKTKTRQQKYSLLQELEKQRLAFEENMKEYLKKEKMSSTQEENSTSNIILQLFGGKNDENKLKAEQYAQLSAKDLLEQLSLNVSYLETLFLKTQDFIIGVKRQFLFAHLAYIKTNKYLVRTLEHKNNSDAASPRDELIENSKIQKDYDQTTIFEEIQIPTQSQNQVQETQQPQVDINQQDNKLDQQHDNNENQIVQETQKELQEQSEQQAEFNENSPLVIEQEIIELPQEDEQYEDCEWLNSMMKVFISEWENSLFFKRYALRILNEILNEDLNKNVKKITLESFELPTNDFPRLKNIKKLPSEQFEVNYVYIINQNLAKFLYDMNLEFEGSLKALVHVEAKIEIKQKEYNIPIKIKLEVTKFFGSLKLCIVPYNYGRSWFTFNEEPTVNFTLDPVIVNQLYPINNLPILIDLIKFILIDSFQTVTFPKISKLIVPGTIVDKFNFNP